MAIRDYVIKWGSLDENFLDNLIAEWDLDEEDVLDFQVESSNICEDINPLIYSAFELIRGAIDEKVNKYLKYQLDTNKYNIVKDFYYEPNIFINYLDSSIDDWLYYEGIVTKDGIQDEEKLIEYLFEKGIIEEIEDKE